MIAELKKKEAYGEKNILYTFECPGLAQKAKPGQFVEIRVNDGMEPFLRRPISIFDATDTELKLLVKTVGKGTAMMSEWESGKKTDIIGPLGNGFVIDPETENVLLVGGGIGVAPLYYLAKELVAQDKKVNLLYSPKRDSEVMGAYKDLEEKLQISFSENRTELPKLIEQQLSGEEKMDMIYTCGPTAMMQTVAEKGKENGVPTQVSLEEKMGCGMGICVGCVVAIKTKVDDFEYKRVCHDGPVFNGEEVIFS